MVYSIRKYASMPNLEHMSSKTRYNASVWLVGEVIALLQTDKADIFWLLVIYIEFHINPPNQARNTRYNSNPLCY